MAGRNEGSKSPNELKRQIARSREEVIRQFGGFREELDVPKKIRRSFRHHPGRSIAIVAVAGVLLALWLTRRRIGSGPVEKSPRQKSKLVQAGLTLGLLRIAANVARPYIEKFVQQKISSFNAPEK